ncbi:hypothetical protein DPMN_075951 [Dreissena polymorpha]|uniref:Uncharacterized protein n=1 Tax=Dreissena polymorpha TaxID=45954 RepID=A0A9D4BLZ0_DREPO|nr:hypothetical protein DPMN_075951 [Dreissena polymorpha]
MLQCAPTTSFESNLLLRQQSLGLILSWLWIMRYMTLLGWLMRLIVRKFWHSLMTSFFGMGMPDIGSTPWVTSHPRSDGIRPSFL